jgi:fructose-bisphosphate aldolase class I
MNISIIGNITHDNYISLDPNSAELLNDQHGNPVLTAPFDNRDIKYYAHSEILGGSAITESILKDFGISTNFIGSYDNPIDRFILTDSDRTFRIFPTHTQMSAWSPVGSSQDYLYIDRSAELTQDQISEIATYLARNPQTKLIIFLSKRDLPTDQLAYDALTEQAFLVITDTDASFPAASVLRLTDGYLTFANSRIKYPADRASFMTTLTTHTIIAAAFTATFLQTNSAEQALLSARTCLDLATLTTTPSPARIRETIQGQEYLIESTTESEIRATAAKLLTPGKGILAADESGGSIAKKFAAADIPDEEEVRRNYRNIFFTTPDISNYLSGIILFDETARQFSDDGKPFPEFIANLGIIPGIKVDLGLEPISDDTEETHTKGLDTLDARLAEYYAMGARFAKWRAAFTVSDSTPSDQDIETNCQELTEYAALCQKNHIVPIVEPELVYDGDYDLEASKAITSKILYKLFEQLQQREIDLSACILKTNMCLAGKRYHTQSTAEEVGAATAEVLRATCPDQLAGVVFLSGGQAVDQATANLHQVIEQGPFPWAVTFSFARAFQDPVIELWRNNPDNIPAAQAAFTERLVENTNALKK